MFIDSEKMMQHVCDTVVGWHWSVVFDVDLGHLLRCEEAQTVYSRAIVNEVLCEGLHLMGCDVTGFCISGPILPARSVDLFGYTLLYIN